jgi:hypothetical protein
VRADDAPRTGEAVDALAGVNEVPLAVPNRAGVEARLGFDYGWTEPVLHMNDQHHRAQLDAAISVTPLPWLSAAVRVLGRYDVSGGGEHDDGVVSETHLGARATFPLGGGVYAGGDVSLWLPGGADVGGSFEALSGDAQLLLAYAPESSPLTLGLSLGLRVDRSRFGGGDPSAYSAADRLTLGVSDAMLAMRDGVALAYRLGRVELVAEWAYRMYFKYAAASPMWVRAGARYRPTARLQLELLLGVSPSERPSLADGAPLRVIEPRLVAGMSVGYAFGGAALQPSAAERGDRPVEVPAVSQPLTAAVRGRVLTPNAEAISGASVALVSGDLPLRATSDAQGNFAFIGVAAGEYQLSVAAPGFGAQAQPLTLHGGDHPSLQLVLKRELPQGQIRGTVRRFNGKPVVASVVIAELGITQQTRADGSFQIDVPPGTYSVAVNARGFKPHTRKAKVELHGVAILIVELEVAR